MTRTARKPASAELAIFAFGLDERRARARRPRRRRATSAGPPACAGRASARRAPTRAPSAARSASTHGDTLARECVKTLKASCSALPRGPGVYLFRDEARRRPLRRQGEVAALPRAQLLPARRRARRASASSSSAIADVEVIVTRPRPRRSISSRTSSSATGRRSTSGCATTSRSRTSRSRSTDEYPRVMFTRERHRRGTVYFGPYANAKKVRETLDVLNRVFRFRPCEGPQPGPALRDPVPRLPHRPLLRALHRRDLAGGLRRDHRRRDRVPLRRHADRSSASSSERMREAAADERFEEAARYRNRLFAIRHLARAAGGRPAGRRHGRRDRARGRRRPGRRAGLPAPRREDDRPLRLPPRERRGRGSRRRCSRRSARVLRRARRAIPPQVARPAGRRRHERARRVPRASGAARASRCERRCAARSAASSELADENARLALESRRGAPRGSTRQRRVEALEELREALNLESLPAPDRVLRRLEHPGRVDRRVDGRLRRRPAEERALPHVRRSAGSTGRTTSAAMREVVARRFARAAATAERCDESFSRRSRTSSSSTAGRGSSPPRSRRCEDARPAARRRHRAREARGGGLRPGVAGADRARPLEPGAPASPARSATRRIASRSATTGASAATRSMETIFDDAPGRRPGAAARDPAALRLGRAVPRRVAGGARGRSRAPAEDRARALRAAAQGRARPEPRLAVASRSRRPAASAFAGSGSVRSVSAIAVKPATTFVAVIVSFIPTLNASSFELRHRRRWKHVEQERLLGPDARRA